MRLRGLEEVQLSTWILLVAIVCLGVWALPDVSVEQSAELAHGSFYQLMKLIRLW